ncbi:2-desacetyl-2-hydroxyethyl bacteriochlorophyllide A dehydrogenase [Mycobacterium frederiksbergense]|uniref:2-desacetyl-2-hydroxyethyl bacteriochlorophyllide A dehydrogenase n=1 Tax=Mycolicibacterium frederiksbergense TaxID=117567 RepID=A0ABT6KVH9_9MYCO|nr:alcohol dehydrogenase catalytic domain-containing protein [Mycolicibacterium frederiksbergense]MDH6194723.1 2-desacetyl-2-hydroxyethyl bacteriochlorophyllide A dehydrogenase [Mycolicibacterium frederiksbergense]
MRALVYEAPRTMNMREEQRPAPGRGDVLIRVLYSGICGSELSGFLGQNSLRTPPQVFGHELSGYIEEIGADVPEQWAVGARVTANPLVSCGQCAYCVSARHQLCQRRLLLGASLPGSNAEYVVVPAAALEAVPDGMDLRDASMAEPAACAVHAVSLAEIGPASSALVVGAGPIGLFIIQVLRAHGVTRVLVTDRNDERRRMAAALGAIPVLGGEEQLLAEVHAHTGAGVQVAFDAAGTQDTRRICVAATAPGGKVMLVGLHTDETSLPVNTVIRNEIALCGVFAYTPSAFRTALSWLADGRLGLRTGVVEADLADGPDWYQRLVAGDPAAKVLLRPAPAAEGDA